VRRQQIPLWSLTGSAAAIRDPSDVIALAALMEHDFSDPNSVVSAVQVALTASLLAAKSSGFGRDQLVGKLITDMFGALSLGAAGGALNTDERIGIPQEVRLTATDLQQARCGHSVVKTLSFLGDGGSYE